MGDNMTNKVSIQKIVAVSDALLAITDDVKILRNIAWDERVQHEFFRYDAQRLPFVEYPKYDAAPILARIAAVRKEIAEVPHIKKYASRIADKLESSAFHQGYRLSRRIGRCPQFLAPGGG